MKLRNKNGQIKDFKSLFLAYDSLPSHKQDPDVRDNIREAMIGASTHGLTNEQERERMYAPDGEWFGVIKYVEDNNAGF